MTTEFSYPVRVTEKNGPHCHFDHGYQQKIAQPLELDGRGGGLKTTTSIASNFVASRARNTPRRKKNSKTNGL
jgi:hypothetical protein